MAKKRKSRTAGFLNTQTNTPLPTPEEVNKVVARVTGKEKKEEQATPKTVIPKSVISSESVAPAPQPQPKTEKRVPLTTAITPENRAKLEVASINGEGSVADLLNEALDYYFENILIIEDTALIETFKTIYARKVK